MTQKKGFTVLIFSAALLIAAAVIRFFQYVSVIDFSTGFYIHGNEAAVSLLRAMLCIGVAGLLVLCIVGQKKKWTAFTIASDGLGDKTTLVLGAAYFAAAAIEAWALLTDEHSTKMSVAVAAAGIVFVVTGFLLVKNKIPPRASGLIQIIPSLCMFAGALNRFNSDLVIGNRSDGRIALLAYIFGAVFFASAARCFARIETSWSRPKEIFFAGLTLLFSGTHLLPKLLAYLFGGNRVLGMEPIDKTVVCLFILSAVFLCTLFFTEQRKSIEYIVEDKKDGKDKNGEDEEKEEEKS